MPNGSTRPASLATPTPEALPLLGREAGSRPLHSRVVLALQNDPTRGLL